MTVYEKGNIARLTGTFTDIDENLIDPTAVYIAYKNPSGTLTTLQFGVDAAVKKSGTGLYYYDLTVDDDGVWWFRWYSDGVGTAAAEASFTIRELQTQ